MLCLDKYLTSKIRHAYQCTCHSRHLPINRQDFFLNRSPTYFYIFDGQLSFCGATGTPCFGFLVTSPLGFKARVGSALFALSGGVCYTFLEIHLHVPTSWRPAAQPVTSPLASAEVGKTRLYEFQNRKKEVHDDWFML